MIYHLLLWSVLTVLAAQLLVISALVVTDARSRRSCLQGHIPCSRPASRMIGESEVQVYTCGEELYAAMLHAIQDARSCVLCSPPLHAGSMCAFCYRPRPIIPSLIG